MVSIITQIIVIVILLMCSALVSASEVAFFIISPTAKAEILKSKNSKIIEKLYNNTELTLATVLVMNNFINIAIVIISTYISAHLFIGVTNGFLYILIQLVGITFAILLFGEMMPKIYARKYPAKILKLMIYPIYVSSKICYPISFFLLKTTSHANKRLRNKHQQDISIKELSQAIELASDDLKDDKEMLEDIVNSSSLDVKEIMTSRIDVFALEYDTKFSEALSQIVESGFSRIPVYVDNLDNIKGILYIKDVLPYINNHAQENFEWQKLLRPHYIIPENKKISELLTDFQTKKLHIALIVDEYGGVSGLVTLEDVLEEFVGEINDESDVEEHNYTKIDEYNYEFDAKTNIVDFCKIVDKDYSFFTEIKGEADTLAGLILEVYGEIPPKNTVIKIGEFEFTIITSNERRIKKVKVKLLNENIENE